MMGRSRFPGSDDPEVQDGDYYGGKWGIHLRAPDLWFKLLDAHGDKLTPLGDIAEVRFGVKSGNDSFFFPIDCSDDCLEAQGNPLKFEAAYGVPRQEWPPAGSSWCVAGKAGAKSGLLKPHIWSRKSIASWRSGALRWPLKIALG
jgi:hypothetical protein